MTRPIDWHAHWIPPRLADLLRSRPVTPRIALDPSGEKEVLLREEGGPGQPLPATFVSLDARLRALDRAEVERQVLSLPGFFGDDTLPLADTLALARAFNDGLSELIVRHPERFSGLAILPASHPEEAAEELERSLRDLGLIGALLPVDAFLTLASARTLEPILAVAEEWGAHLFVHPGGWRGSRHGHGTPAAVESPAADTFRTAVLDLQGRISSAYVTLAYTDLLVPYPSVTVQLANLGGALPFYADRLHNVAAKRGLSDPISPLRRIYVDTGSLSTNSVELAAKVLGTDRLLFGTDDPVFSLAANVDGIRASRLTQEEQRDLLAENGRPLLHRRQRRQPAKAAQPVSAPALIPA